jgi:hypothetical protein
MSHETAVLNCHEWTRLRDGDVSFESATEELCDTKRPCRT